MNDALMKQIGKLFQDAGFELYLVGGSVRDMVLKRPIHDWDFTTDARPESIRAVIQSWADNIWAVGARFGTIGCQKDGFDIEITTMRSDGPGRKPEVRFCDSLELDLKRRDFTMNAMAIKVDSYGMYDEEIIDPFRGRAHMARGIINTPGDPRVSFSNDPLRILRAVRFSSQLSMVPHINVTRAMRKMGATLETVSAERILAEMNKLLMGKSAELGMRQLLNTYLHQHFLVEINGVEIPFEFSGDVIMRWAQLLRDVPMSAVAELTRRLRMSNDDARAIKTILAADRMSIAYDWTNNPHESARRVIAKSKEHIDSVMQFIDQADARLAIITVLETEGHPTPFMSGKQVADMLSIKPGPELGKAMDYLWDKRLEMGNLSKSRIEGFLMRWAKREGIVAHADYVS